MQVSYYLSEPEGQRITSLYVVDKKSKTPLDDDKMYLVVAPLYLARGGDGFKVRQVFEVSTVGGKYLK